MNIVKHLLPLLLLVPLLSSPAFGTEEKLVIARGGAAGHLTAHTLPAVTLAIAMDADMIKIDLVLTRDNEVVVLPSPYLEESSNVRELFADRIREDGHFYALDFDLEEIRLLSRLSAADRVQHGVQPRMSIPTFGEELALIQGLEKSLHKRVAIAVEIKQPWLHRREKRDITSPVLDILQSFDYGNGAGKLFLLSYDETELRSMARTLLPKRGMAVKLVQLIESNHGRETMTEEWGEWSSYNYDWMFSNTGLRSLSRSVSAIGIPKEMLADPQGQLKLDTFVKNAHRLGTMIFTFITDKEQPSEHTSAQSFTEELEFFYFTADVDGVITDFCGEAVHYLQNRPAAPQMPVEDKGMVSPTPTTIDPLHLTSPLQYQPEN